MGLPNGYTQVAYVASHGAGYINTGWKFGPNNYTNARVVADAFIPVGDAYRVSGCGQFSAFYYGVSQNSKLVYGNGKNDSESSISYSGRRTIFDLDLGKGTYTAVDAYTNEIYGSVSVSKVAPTGGDLTFFLFGYDSGAGYCVQHQEWIYSCKIYEGNTVVRDLVPAVRNSDGVAGLYDQANNTFYAGAGTKALVAGPEVKTLSGYKLLPYIESSGTQHINTGFVANQNTRVLMDTEYFDASVTAPQATFGARVGWQKSMLHVMTATNYAGATFGYAAASNTNVSMNTFGRLLIDSNKNVLTINNVTHTAASASFSATYPLFLFAVNNAGSVLTSATKSSMRLYSCQIYDNGTLVRDYVPVRRNSDGAIGLLDQVDNVFYGNAGTGTFIAGPEAEYTWLEWIGSSGTQYVNTEYKPNQNTRVVLDVEVTLGATSFLFGARHNSSANAESKTFCLVQMSGTSFRTDYGSKEESMAVNPVQRHVIDKNKNHTTVNGVESLIAAQTFSCQYNLLLLTVNTAGTVNATKTSAKIYSCQIYDNGTLIRDYKPAKRSDGVVGLYDAVNDRFYTNAGTGTFKAGPEIKEYASLSLATVDGTEVLITMCKAAVGGIEYVVSYALANIDGVEVLIPLGESAGLIEFGIETDYNSGVYETFEAEEGMTWRDWIESEYNTAGFYVKEFASTNRIQREGGGTGSGIYVATSDGGDVKASDEIAAGHQYKARMVL